MSAIMGPVAAGVVTYVEDPTTLLEAAAGAAGEKGATARLDVTFMGAQIVSKLLALPADASSDSANAQAASVALL
eukprot:9086470-Pyramimonas_sp.AAC.1